MDKNTRVNVEVLFKGRRHTMIYPDVRLNYIADSASYRLEKLRTITIFPARNILSLEMTEVKETVNE